MLSVMISAYWPIKPLLIELGSVFNTTFTINKFMKTVKELKSWLARVKEEIVDPERPLVDAHHHLWRKDHRREQYLVEDLWEDTGSGHHIEQTVFIDCVADYFTGGPAMMRPVGETRFVVESIEQTRRNVNAAHIGAIVSHADLSQGAPIQDVLQAHIDAGKGWFRGIRHHGSWSASEAIENSRIDPPPNLYTNPKFHEGFACLAPLGLSFDAWLYHPDIPDLTELAHKFPETTIILDHLGGPLGIGPYAGYRNEVFYKWKQDVASLARCSNVVAKLGGMAMPINGFGWDSAEKPATSDEIVSAHSPYYLHMIEHFGPERCMFESNFPVEKVSLSYHVLWNAFKKIAARFSESEQEALLRGTAVRFYRMEERQ